MSKGPIEPVLNFKVSSRGRCPLCKKSAGTYYWTERPFITAQQYLDEQKAMSRVRGESQKLYDLCFEHWMEVHVERNRRSGETDSESCAEDFESLYSHTHSLFEDAIQDICALREYIEELHIHMEELAVEREKQEDELREDIEDLEKQVGDLEERLWDAENAALAGLSTDG